MITPPLFDVKRNEILDSAQNLFMEHGYESTSVNAILNDVGIAKGTFYYYFTSKEAVMDGVIMRIIKEEMVHVEVIRANENFSPLEKLIYGLFSKPKSRAKAAVLEKIHQPDNALMKQRALQRTLEQVCPLYASVIAQGNEQGVFHALNPLADIQFLVAGIQTLYDMSGIHHSSITIDLDVIITMMVRVLKLDESLKMRDRLYALILQAMDPQASQAGANQ